MRKTNLINQVIVNIRVVTRSKGTTFSELVFLSLQNLAKTVSIRVSTFVKVNDRMIFLAAQYTIPCMH